MARLLLLVSFFLCFVYFTEAYDFYVGVRNGWVVKPAENYNNWAERMRFQVKDKLIFNYKKGEDSVLVVKKEDYDSCNTKNPITKFEDGKSVFVFDRSGPFFFISGADGHCAQGQKLIVVVLAVRNKPISPPPSPVPGTKPPKSSPSPAPVVKPPSSSLSPSPASKPPSTSPSSSPYYFPLPTESPAPSPVPSGAKSPSPASPTTSPAPSPVPSGAKSPSPSPSSPASPTASPASSPVPSGAKSPSPSSTSPAAPPGGPGASVASPPPSSSAPGAGGGGGGGGIPAVTPSSNSTSTPTSSAQTLSVSRLSYGVFALFLGAVVLF